MKVKRKHAGLSLDTQSRSASNGLCGRSLHILDAHHLEPLAPHLHFFFTPPPPNSGSPFLWNRHHHHVSFLYIVGFLAPSSTIAYE